MQLLALDMTKHLISLFFLFALMNSAYANKSLDQFFQQTQSMQANFEQTVTNKRGKLLEQSSGNLVISRPDKFILAYQSPAEQKYISNGQTIWIYDVELEQVSIKELDESIGDSPALLLSSNTNVYKHYNVTDLKYKKTGNYTWIQLQAKKEEMTFEKVLLAFKGSKLMRMIMHDSFGQITSLKFSDIQINKHFSLRQFNFSAPEGVDVIGAAGAR